MRRSKKDSQLQQLSLVSHQNMFFFPLGYSRWVTWGDLVILRASDDGREAGPPGDSQITDDITLPENEQRVKTPENRPKRVNSLWKLGNPGGIAFNRNGVDSLPKRIHFTFHLNRFSSVLGWNGFVGFSGNCFFLFRLKKYWEKKFMVTWWVFAASVTFWMSSSSPWVLSDASHKIYPPEPNSQSPWKFMVGKTNLSFWEDLFSGKQRFVSFSLAYSGLQFGRPFSMVSW